MIPNYPYPPKMDEDCLYLNIYTPAESPEDRLPVMMYIHGGGLQQWYGSDYEYCGDALCRQGVILVSITYRLNVFGFLTHPELAVESEHGSSGNYGLLDHIQALKWIRENIAAFGGDPYNVTCFGQSGGARWQRTISPMPRSNPEAASAVGSRPPQRNGWSSAVWSLWNLWAAGALRKCALCPGRRSVTRTTGWAA
jgi:para-nitrobenzyl esterase